MWSGGAALRGSRPLAELIDVVSRSGFSFLIPVFFVTSGMGLDISAVGSNIWLLLGFVAAIALVRGVPVWLRERFSRTESGLGAPRDQVALGLYSAAGLPIIVAVTELATRSGLIEDTLASVLVAAGAVTVLLFPLIASLLRGADAQNGQAPARAASAAQHTP
ncbi:cation:proton antiporter [Georgenia sp. 10Sc9-8]|uniref:Cation:proton antiporter n=1 Tax=Georgenia halotolerans TaxID=3028317 RepID=A0ABT5TXR1_9MICO|nr:cation:proton antiporter [Georgenia halotolerans]